MKKCPICQAEQADQERECACGYEFAPDEKVERRQKLLRLLSFIGILIILVIVLGLAFKTREIGRHTQRVSRKIGQVRQTNDSLKAIITSLKQTENYFYNMGIQYRQRGRYERSNRFFLEKIKRFPESNINAKADEFIRQNNQDWAQELLDNGKQACQEGDKALAIKTADEIIFRFPESDQAKQARALKAGKCGSRQD
jgi:TolA-binding protein